jgi:6-phosphogluconolactonase
MPVQEKSCAQDERIGCSNQRDKREQGKKMKGITTSRGLKALAVSMALGLGMTACSRDYVVGYLYATNAKLQPGVITGYEIDYETGQLTQLADSPIPAGGNNTVTIVASPNGKNLYVLNHDTSTVVQFDIGTDGKIYPENTYNVVQGTGTADAGVTGTFPMAAAVDAAGKFLYVIFTYQNGYTTVRPGPGGIAGFPINADGSLGAALTNTTTGTTLPYVPLGFNPVGITVPATGGYVYVIDQDGPPGTLISFAENPSTGALSSVGTAAGIPAVGAGGAPSAITEDPTGHFLYVTDSTNNVLDLFTVTAGVPFRTSTIPTGLTPMGVTIDPRGKFLYVANYNSNSVSSYTINSAAGGLTASGTPFAVGTGPTCVAIDPALGIYLYTSNEIGNNVSGEQLNPQTGALLQIQGTPFNSQSLTTCLVAVANGAHASQLVQ